MLIDFIKSPEWQQIKSFLKEVDISLDIKTSGMTNEMIALEVRARQLMDERLKKTIARIERMAKTEIRKEESFK